MWWALRRAPCGTSAGVNALMSRRDYRAFEVIHVNSENTLPRMRGRGMSLSRMQTANPAWQTNVDAQH
jgi:hypothetical protein